MFLFNERSHISDQRRITAEILLQAVWDTEENDSDNNIETKTYEKKHNQRSNIKTEVKENISLEGM